MNKYDNGSIYLSGGMQHTPDGLGAGWRRDCAQRLKELNFFPLDIAEMDNAYRAAHGHIFRWSDDENFLQLKSNIRKHFVDTDIALIRNDTDALVVLYDDSVRLGAGTISEIHEAYMMGMPVFLLNSYGSINEVPGWMQAETTRIFDAWEELYNYLGKLPPGILKKDIYGNRSSGNFYLCSLCGTVEEKHGSHFVSTVSPQYCKQCVQTVRHTFEEQHDRYTFFKQHYISQRKE